MNAMLTVDWDGIELLPRKSCNVCGKYAVPWGRMPGDRFVCSKRCCSAHALRATLEEPAFQAFLREAGFFAAEEVVAERPMERAEIAV